MESAVSAGFLSLGPVYSLTVTASLCLWVVLNALGKLAKKHTVVALLYANDRLLFEHVYVLANDRETQQRQLREPRMCGRSTFFCNFVDLVLVDRTKFDRHRHSWGTRIAREKMIDA